MLTDMSDEVGEAELSLNECYVMTAKSDAAAMSTGITNNLRSDYTRQREVLGWYVNSEL